MQKQREVFAKGRSVSDYSLNGFKPGIGATESQESHRDCRSRSERLS
jgi:hypothetical protein